MNLADVVASLQALLSVHKPGARRGRNVVAPPPLSVQAVGVEHRLLPFAAASARVTA